MIKEYIKGSILDAPQKYIAHGCNAQNKMGSGVAKVLFEEYTEVKEVYHNFCKERLSKYSRKSDLLGDVCVVELKNQKHKCVFNCFTQEYYGYSGYKFVNYDAIYNCFKELSRRLYKKEIAIPKIGCGLAGGNWEIVSRIIDDATGDDLDVYVYYLEDK